MRKVMRQEFITLEGFAAGTKSSVDFVPAATTDDRSFGREQLALREPQTVDRLRLASDGLGGH